MYLHNYGYRLYAHMCTFVDAHAHVHLCIYVYNLYPCMYVYTFTLTREGGPSSQTPRSSNCEDHEDEIACEEAKLKLLAKTTCEDEIRP